MGVEIPLCERRSFKCYKCSTMHSVIISSEEGCSREAPIFVEDIDFGDSFENDSLEWGSSWKGPLPSFEKDWDTPPGQQAGTTVVSVVDPPVPREEAKEAKVQQLNDTIMIELIDELVETEDALPDKILSSLGAADVYEGTFHGLEDDDDEDDEERDDDESDSSSEASDSHNEQNSDSDQSDESSHVDYNESETDDYDDIAHLASRASDDDRIERENRRIIAQVAEELREFDALQGEPMHPIVVDDCDSLAIEDQEEEIRAAIVAVADHEDDAGYLTDGIREVLGEFDPKSKTVPMPEAAQPKRSVAQSTKAMFGFYRYGHVEANEEGGHSSCDDSTVGSTASESDGYDSSGDDASYSSYSSGVSSVAYDDDELGHPIPRNSHGRRRRPRSDPTGVHLQIHKNTQSPPSIFGEVFGNWGFGK